MSYGCKQNDVPVRSFRSFRAILNTRGKRDVSEYRTESDRSITEWNTCHEIAKAELIDNIAGSGEMNESSNWLRSRTGNFFL